MFRVFRAVGGLGTHWGNIRVILGLYGIMEKKMESIIMG